MEFSAAIFHHKVYSLTAQIASKFLSLDLQVHQTFDTACLPPAALIHLLFRVKLDQEVASRNAVRAFALRHGMTLSNAKFLVQVDLQ